MTDVILQSQRLAIGAGPLDGPFHRLTRGCAVSSQIAAPCPLVECYLPVGFILFPALPEARILSRRGLLISFPCCQHGFVQPIENRRIYPVFRELVDRVDSTALGLLPRRWFLVDMHTSPMCGSQT